MTHQEVQRLEELERRIEELEKTALTRSQADMQAMCEAVDKHLALELRRQGFVRPARRNIVTQRFVGDGETHSFSLYNPGHPKEHIQITEVMSVQVDGEAQSKAGINGDTQGYQSLVDFEKNTLNFQRIIPRNAIVSVVFGCHTPQNSVK